MIQAVGIVVDTVECMTVQAEREHANRPDGAATWQPRAER